MRSLRSTVDLGLAPDRKGKVREIFDLGEELLIVATDRISAYDVIMDQTVPGRGCVLTVMTLAWLDHFKEIPNHLITAEADLFPSPFSDLRDELAGRSMLVRKARPFPVECIARGYITGSGWRSYLADGTICGHTLPEGLLKSQQLESPLYTPSTKAETGHDQNISFAESVDLIGDRDARRLRDLTLDLYARAAAYAKAGGVLIADTKFEFGRIDGNIVLIDEVLTPDSSRFWPSAEHVPGEEPPSWDKQILRNHLDTLDWDQTYPPPRLPREILDRTAARYLEVLNILFAEEARRWHAILSLNRRRRALLSVTDKSGLDALAGTLADHGYDFVASGGTAAHLRRLGHAVAEVSDVTGFPEIFGGRVKTLHPKVFGGILGAAEADFAEVADLGVAPVDVVVCNLYDFAATVSGGGDHAAVVEKIDIGGPSLLRAAAKNHARVCVLCDPELYEDFAAACEGGGGFPDAEFRRRMAAETFALVADYDAQIAEYFEGTHHDGHLSVELRYGENPHQRAELFLPGDDADDPLAGMGLVQLNGKALSFNNFVDVIAAAKLVGDLEGVCCAAIKHTNPCGVGVASTPAEALERALRCDPDSAFGGVFAFTSEVDEAAVEILRKRFCEVVLAPSYAEEALEILCRKKNLRVLTLDPGVFAPATRGKGLAFGQVQLHQEEDEGFPELEAWSHAAGPEPDPAMTAALKLQWKVCKHVKSNAIVLGDHEATLGVGAGQMSRVDSTRIAVRKAGDQNLSLKGCVCASDAFFPFPDSIERLHEAGVAGVIAPGGSIRDEEVIEAANRLGVTLIHTDRRHFRH